MKAAGATSSQRCHWRHSDTQAIVGGFPVSLAMFSGYERCPINGRTFFETTKFGRRKALNRSPPPQDCYGLIACSSSLLEAKTANNPIIEMSTSGIAKKLPAPISLVPIIGCELREDAEGAGVLLAKSEIEEEGCAASMAISGAEDAIAKAAAIMKNLDTQFSFKSRLC